MNEVFEESILDAIYEVAYDHYKHPNNSYYEGRFSGAVAVASYVVPREKISKIKAKAQAKVEEEGEKEP